MIAVALAASTPLSAQAVGPDAPAPPAASAAPDAVAALPTVGPWQATAKSLLFTLLGNEGIATVALPTGGTRTWYSGTLTVPVTTYAKGWTHVGDPDSVGGYVTEPYQWGGTGPAVSKMFRIWKPGGGFADFTHRLSGDEEYNNSFTALTPDGDWMVGGEWGTESRLLIYPTPLLNPAATDPAKDLPLTGDILLDHPVGEVQGCSFTSPTRLLCASDEAAGTQFGVVDPLLQVDLDQPITDGTSVHGHVTPIGPLPLQSACTAAPASGYEVEGTDYYQGTLRVEVIQPGLCEATTTLWTFTQPAP